MDDSSKRDRGESREHAADPTIVGGRPFGSARAQTGIPRGIEVLVKKASVDREFREVLLDKRASAAAEIGLDLSSAETSMLNSVPRAQIEQVIDNTTVPKEHRRVFLGKIGAAMVAMLCTGISTGGCIVLGLTVYRGMTTDRPIRPAIEGIEPDYPPSVQRMPGNRDRVRPEEERLKVEVVNSGKHAVTVNVDFECPFGDGEIITVFGPGRDSAGAQVTCNPVVALVSKGKGKVIFTGEGKRGTTEWLLVRLVYATGACKAKFSAPFTQNDLKLAADLQPGEYKIDNCAIYRIAKFRKVWSA